MKINKHKSDWDSIAGMDPMWAILSDPSKKFGKWERDVFFRSGESEAGRVIRTMEETGYPVHRRRALDFGCGLGRVTRFFAGYFDEVVGVDISDQMILKARELNADLSNCKFIVNDKENLALFPDNSFDFIYSYIVLQHVPTRKTIFDYVSEFLRILHKDGLLFFQLPESLPLLIRLQPRRTLYKVLRRLGFTDATLYWKFGLHPIRMNSVPGSEMTEGIGSNGGYVIKTEKERDDRFPVDSNIYIVTKK